MARINPPTRFPSRVPGSAEQWASPGLWVWPGQMPPSPSGLPAWPLPRGWCSFVKCLPGVPIPPLTDIPPLTERLKSPEGAHEKRMVWKTLWLFAFVSLLIPKSDFASVVWRRCCCSAELVRKKCCVLTLMKPRAPLKQHQWSNNTLHHLSLDTLRVCHWKTFKSRDVSGVETTVASAG